jgi:DNA-binding MarR family transcriptional regulator
MGSGTYWYDGDESAARGRRVLQALRVYQAAEVAMRRRTRSAMSMGENEMLALRFLIRADAERREATPTDIARYLGVSTASTTSLIDRMTDSGHVVRVPHPSDRRRITVFPTELAQKEVRATLGDMHARMMAATAGLSAAEAEVIIGFLDRVSRAVDQVADAAPTAADATAGSAVPAVAVPA